MAKKTKKSSGSRKKFLNRVEAITFSGPEAVRKGQQVLYITERAVFRLSEQGLVLTEIAPGVDLQRDILDLLDFVVEVAENLKEMEF